MTIIFLDFLALFLVLAGFIIGLGAVTVIDIHGFLARTSKYWTEATIRTHKVTKPLIWVGIVLVVIGGALFYRQEALVGIPLIHTIAVGVLVLNGLFLSFVVSPFLLRRERGKRAKVLLPAKWQRRIFVSFIISDIGWWGSLLLLIAYLLQ